jgi:hypothetical protein
MPRMLFRAACALIAPLLVPSLAHATWSVIAIDLKTKTVVIASATCVTGAGLQGRGGLKSIQAVIVPGIGIAAAQAGVDSTRRNQQLVYDELGILDMQGRWAGFSGERNGEWSVDYQGRVPNTEIIYSVQGNILRSMAVVENAVKALRSTNGDLTDRVMAAMEAADAAGGDSRCSCENPKNPKTEATVCTAKTSHVAYILRAEATDKSGPEYQNGEYALFIDVTDQNIKAGEDANPVKTLRMRYDAHMKSVKK